MSTTGVNTLECIICYNEYDWQQRKPCIGTCGHSICESCKYQMQTAKCPHCNREEAFVLTTINYQVLELMKQFQAVTMAGDLPVGKTISRDPKNFEEGICSQCTSQSKKLRICVDCGVKAGILTNIDNDVSLNLSEITIYEAVEAARKEAICGDCVLDGVHSGHRTIYLSVLKKDLDGVHKKKVKEKLDVLEMNISAVVSRLQKSFAKAVADLRVYHECDKCLLEGEKKAHFNNCELSIEQVNDTISMLLDTIKRLEVTNSDVEKQTNHVETTRKAFSKRNIIFANSEPTLIADRKQSSKEALLIGIFDPTTKSWTSVGRMPNQKSNYAVASYFNRIFIVGGMNNGNWLQALELYDRDKNLRRDGARMKRGRTRTSAGFHNGKMFVAGGYDGSYMKSVEMYDPETNEWKDGPDLRRQRADCSVLTCNGELYVLGGYNGKEYEEKIERLNEDTNVFEDVGDMKGSRAGFGACVFRGRIYVAGGWSNSNNTLKTVRSYDPIALSWRDEPSMIRDRKYFTLHATNDAVFAIRGCADSWSLIPEVERLNTETNKWEVIPCVAQLNSVNNTTQANSNSSTPTVA